MSDNLKTILKGMVVLSIIAASSSLVWAGSSPDETIATLNGGTRSAEEIMRLIHSIRIVDLNDLTIEGRLSINAHELEELICDNVIFTHGIDIGGDNPEATLNFIDCIFRGPISTHKQELKHLLITHGRFEQDVDLDSLKADSLIVKNSTVLGNIWFTRMNLRNMEITKSGFEGIVDLTGSEFSALNDLSFDYLRSKEPIRISWAQFGDRWLQKKLAEARTTNDLQQIVVELQNWRSNFIRLGYMRDANEANYQSIELRRSYLMRPSQIDWWIAYVFSLPNRYGTRPYRPVWVGLALILAFSLFYRMTDPFVPQKEEPKRPKTPLLLFSLLFSIDTFLPVISVTRVREWGWEIASSYRWIELSERLIGLVLSVLAAYGIGYQVL